MKHMGQTSCVGATLGWQKVTKLVRSSNQLSVCAKIAPAANPLATYYEKFVCASATGQDGSYYNCGQDWTCGTCTFVVKGSVAEQCISWTGNSYSHDTSQLSSSSKASFLNAMPMCYNAKTGVVGKTWTGELTQVRHAGSVTCTGPRTAWQKVYRVDLSDDKMSMCVKFKLISNPFLDYYIKVTCRSATGSSYSSYNCKDAACKSCTFSEDLQVRMGCVNNGADSFIGDDAGMSSQEGENFKKVMPKCWFSTPIATANGCRPLSVGLWLIGAILLVPRLM